MNGLSKSALSRTESPQTAPFRSWKADSHCSVQTTLFGAAALVRSERGEALSEKLGINLRYHPAKPKKDLTFFLVVGGVQLRMSSTFSTCGRITPSPIT